MRHAVLEPLTRLSKETHPDMQLRFGGADKTECGKILLNRVKSSAHSPGHIPKFQNIPTSTASHCSQLVKMRGEQRIDPKE